MVDPLSVASPSRHYPSVLYCSRKASSDRPGWNWIGLRAMTSPPVLDITGYVGICCWHALKILYKLMYIQFESGARHEKSRPQIPEQILASLPVVLKKYSAYQLLGQISSQVVTLLDTARYLTPCPQNTLSNGGVAVACIGISVEIPIVTRRSMPSQAHPWPKCSSTTNGSTTCAACETASRYVSRWPEWASI